MSYNFSKQDLQELIDTEDYQTIRDNFIFWTYKSKTNLAELIQDITSNQNTELIQSDEDDLDFYKAVKVPSIPQDIIDMAKLYI